MSPLVLALVGTLVVHPSTLAGHASPAIVAAFTPEAPVERTNSTVAAGAPDTLPKPAMFRADPARTGRYETRPVERLGGLRWRFSTRGPVRSTPAVSGEVVYVGSGDGHLYAVGRSCGEERWRFDAGSSVTSSPAVGGGLVFFGGRDGTFFAVDAESGEERWRIGTGEEIPWDWGHESADIFTSSPVLRDDRVLFGSGDGHLSPGTATSTRWTPPRDGSGGAPSSTDGSARAPRCETAGWWWAAPTEACTWWSSRADGSSGASTPRDAPSSPVTSASTARPCSRRPPSGHCPTRAVGAVRRARAARARVPTGRGPDRTGGREPTDAFLRAYVGSKDGHLYAFDLADGRRAWRSDHQVSWVLGGPAVAGRAVYAGTSDGRFVQAVDAETGRELWRFETPSSVWTSPTVAGGVVYVGDNAGFVRALDRESGEELWSFGTGGRMQSSPVPDRGRVFVGSDDGGLYALGGGEPVRRAVFWDSAYVKASWYRGHRDLRDYLSDRGYAVADAAALEAFLEARIEDGAASVVVFAMDAAPAPVVEGGSGSLLRRYLESGGKVVWVGVPPLLWPRDPETGSPGDLTHVDRAATRELLGVDHGRGNFDVYGTWPTPTGEKWGLEGWWRARWAATPDSGVAPLALDEHGLAAAWARGYGGSPGTGFVRIWGDYAPIPDPGVVHTVAEYRPDPACTGER